MMQQFKEIFKGIGYEIIEEISDYVFKAKSLTFNKPCCIKVREISNECTLKSEFNNTKQKSCYKRIIKPLEFIQIPNWNALICELEQTNLKTVIDSPSYKGNKDLVVKVMFDTLLSLQTQHFNNLPHNQIRPENIIFLNGNYVLTNWSLEQQSSMIYQEDKLLTDLYQCAQLFLKDLLKMKDFRNKISIESIELDQIKLISYDLISIYTITNQIFLNENPYLMYTLFQGIDALYKCIGKKFLKQYLKKERQRVNRIIFQPDIPNNILIQYYFYLHLIQKNPITDQYLQQALEILKQQINLEYCTIHYTDIYLEIAKFKTFSKDFTKASEFLVKWFDHLVKDKQTFQNLTYFQYLIQFGEILYQNKKYDKSMNLFWKIKKQAKKIYGNTHIIYLEIKIKYLSSLMEQCKLQRKLFSKLLYLNAKCKILFKETHPLCVEVKILLAKYCEKENNHYFQLDFLEEALAILKFLNNDTSIEIAKCYDLISECYIQIGKVGDNILQKQKALQYALQSFSIKQKIFQNHPHPEILYSLNQISSCYSNLDQLVLAKNACKQGQEMIRDKSKSYRDIQGQIHSYEILKVLTRNNIDEQIEYIYQIDENYKQLQTKQAEIEKQLDEDSETIEKILEKINQIEHVSQPKSDSYYLTSQKLITKEDIKINQPNKQNDYQVKPISKDIESQPQKIEVNEDDFKDFSKQTIDSNQQNLQYEKQEGKESKNNQSSLCRHKVWQQESKQKKENNQIQENQIKIQEQINNTQTSHINCSDTNFTKYHKVENEHFTQINNQYLENISENQQNSQLQQVQSLDQLDISSLSDKNLKQQPKFKKDKYLSPEISSQKYNQQNYLYNDINGKQYPQIQQDQSQINIKKGLKDQELYLVTQDFDHNQFKVQDQSIMQYDDSFNQNLNEQENIQQNLTQNLEQSSPIQSNFLSSQNNSDPQVHNVQFLTLMPSQENILKQQNESTDQRNSDSNI